MCITLNGMVLDYPFSVPGSIKLYGVPPIYSADGYYAAIWTKGDPEPVPASCSQENTLLAHVDMVGMPLQPMIIYLGSGVDYAQN